MSLRFKPVFVYSSPENARWNGTVKPGNTTLSYGKDASQCVSGIVEQNIGSIEQQSSAYSVDTSFIKPVFGSRPEAYAEEQQEEQHKVSNAIVCVRVSVSYSRHSVSK